MSLPMTFLEDVHACIDAMSQAVSCCKSGEWTADEMWLELEAQNQALAVLSNADEGSEDEDGEDAGVEEINFDENDPEARSDFEDDEDIN